jgi:superfamily II RNA helicase
LTSRDVRDNHLQIVLPTASTSALKNDEAARTDDNGKKRKSKGQSKQVPQKKADKIREEHRQEKLEKRIDDEAEQIIHLEDRLKEISIDDYSTAIDLIDQSLSKFETSTNRLKLLKRKFRLQRKYLELLRKKNELTIEEKSQLDLLQIGYFATMTEMVHQENIVDVFDQKTKYMEELVDQSPFDHEIWYRFQLEKINSRLPRREQGIPDSRIPDFIPDQWQVEFLDAVDKQQSIIIVAPTASGLLTFFISFFFYFLKSIGKTYASYYAMNKVLKDPDDPHGICVYIAPTKALVNQVAGRIISFF